MNRIKDGEQMGPEDEHESRSEMMRHADLTERVIAAAYAVHNKMGFGYLESVYGKCMEVELRRMGLPFEAQKGITVYYDDVPVGDFVADLVIEGVVIVELKAVRALAPAHEVQLVNYLTATRMPVGLLINFGAESVEVRRKVLKLPGRKTG